MKTSLIAGAAIALSLAASSCLANPSHAEDAQDLRADLAALPGVQKVALSYVEPVPLDSGKLELKVRMQPHASPQQARKVVATTYAAFRGTHRSEEGDLDVAIGDDVIHLRSFEPEAGTDAVGSALDDALTVLPTGKVTARINTQDVSGEPHVHTEFQVTTDGSRPSLEGAVQAFGRFAEIPRAAWRFGGADDTGWLIGNSSAMPDAAQLRVFDELADGLPDDWSIRMYDGDFVVTDVAADATPDRVARVTARQLHLLAAEGLFFHVESGPDMIAMLMDGECNFDTGPIGARLERDLKDRCTEISHPEDY